MPYDKPFIDYKAMIKKLESRNIIIDDEAFAEMALCNLSYYGLVNGYKNTFLQVPGSDNFIPGTNFKELYTLHLIDFNLNSIILKYILYVEKSLKSKISYLVSQKHGVFTDYNDLSNRNPKDYLCNAYYSRSSSKRDTILRKIKGCITNDNGNPSIIHYTQHKNHVPAWILVNNMPFGLTIEWYGILNPQEKEQICAQFIRPGLLTVDKSKEFFRKALLLLKEYRNKIAHGNRTFNVPGLPVLPKEQTIALSLGTLTKSEYNIKRLGQNDTFAVFLGIMNLINDQYLLSNFLSDCIYVFDPYKGVKFNKKTVYSAFGLPDDIIDRLIKLHKARFT